MATPRPSQSIRARLIWLVLAVLAPALLAGVWTLMLAQHLARDANRRVLEDTARAVARVLDLELAQRAGVARSLAFSRLLDQAPEVPARSLQEFDQQARLSLTGLEGWVELRSPERLLINTRLKRGDLPPPAVPTAPTPLADTPQVLPLSENAQLGLRYAALVQPVMRDGQAVLNLTLTVLPHEFQRIIDQQSLPDDWVAAIIDSEGKVVARHPGGEAYAGRASTPELMSQLRTEREGLIHLTSLDGVPVTVYYRTAPRGWTYITGMPRSQFQGLLSTGVRNVLIGAAVLLALAMAMALWVSRGIVRPIHALKAMAADMQQGRPALAKRTGITECDEVAQAMQGASHAIRGAHAEMERRVEEAVALTRTVEQRMSHSHRLEALGRLTGSVAHDFNNLLGVISNSAYLIEHRASDPAITPAVQATLRSVDAGSRLTQHLLRFAGRQAVSPCSVNVDSFLPDVADLMRAVLGRRIALQVRIDPAAKTLFADPNELELALVNLAINARDAISAQGEVRLHAAPASAAEVSGLPEGEYMALSVEDNGSGIDEAIVKRVFEPFFSTKTAQNASGLGLSQVYGFAQQSGGTARLDSTVGQGTRVSLVLPVRGQAATVHPQDTASQALSVSGTRVLLVEDNDTLRSITAALLESFGCHVTSSPSADEAWERLQSEGNIDVVLTDVLMPGSMDGPALARRVRDTMHLPVVLISGHRGEAEGVHEFPLLFKPCTPEKLLAALQTARQPTLPTNSAAQ